MFHGVHRTERHEKTYARAAARGDISTRLAYVAACATALFVLAAGPAAAQDCGLDGEGEPNTICGYVFTDVNGNGIYDSTDTPVSGASVSAGGTEGLAFATTNSSGFYAISVGDGLWTVTVYAGIPTGSQVDPPQEVNVASNDIHADVNFKVTSEGDVSDGTVPSPCDFLTSGGFVIGDPVGSVAGKKVTFGIHGGCKHGEFWGHLNVVDHATGYHINSTEITGYLVPTNATDPETREICGLATTNKSTDPSSVAFRVRLIDKGEPGRFDLFGIRLSTGYHVSTRLLSDIKPGGGNIQLHDPNPSTTAPEGPPQCWGLASPD